MTEDTGLFAEWDQAISASRPDPMQIAALSARFLAYFNAVQKEAVTVAAASGKSWTEIAAALGTTRQAAWQRFSKALAANPRLAVTAELFLRAREQNFSAVTDAERIHERIKRRPHLAGTSALRQLTDEQLMQVKAELTNLANHSTLTEGERVTLKRVDTVLSERGL